MSLFVAYIILFSRLHCCFHNKCCSYLYILSLFKTTSCIIASYQRVPFGFKAMLMSTTKHYFCCTLPFATLGLQRNLQFTATPLTNPDIEYSQICNKYFRDATRRVTAAEGPRMNKASGSNVIKITIALRTDGYWCLSGWWHTARPDRCQGRLRRRTDYYFCTTKQNWLSSIASTFYTGSLI